MEQTGVDGSAAMRATGRTAGGAGPIRPTIEDVATAAGVSRATVSRVLNGSPRVVPMTRERVLEAAAELGFVPSAAARALAGGRGDRVAVAAISHPGCLDEHRFFSTVTVAAAQAAGDAGFGVFLRRIAPGDFVALRALAADRGLAGLIVINPSPDALAALPAAVARRTVTLGACRPEVAAVDVDNLRATRAALGHLTALGRPRVTLVVGPDDLPCVRERTATYRAHQAELGVPDRLVQAPLGMPDAARALEASFEADGPPEAIFAAGDGLAGAAVEVCRRRGLRVGEDVDVVGFDDDPPPLRQAYDTYAAVRSPVPAIATEALDLIASGDTRAEQRRLPPAQVGLRPPA